MKVGMRYGKSHLEILCRQSVAVLRPAKPTASSARTDTPHRALRNPIGTPPLLDLLRARRPSTVAITISDITRAVPNRVFLPVILETLREAGVHDSWIVIIVGTGMHRPSTDAELEELVGPAIRSQVRVVDHVADDPSSLVEVSTDPHVSVNRHFAEADFRIVTGFIEPHFMAGFSGGRKGVCPALVDLGTIQRFHGFETLSHPLAKEGVLTGNPCHETSLKMARMVGVDFLFNVAVDGEGGITGVYCGDLEAAHAAGCADVSRWNSVRVEGQCDIVVTCGGGYPLDQNFYQTVKGMCMALPAVKETGTLIVVSSCDQQMGSPEYTALMKKYAGRWREFLADRAADTGVTEKDQWELQMQCRVLERIGTDRLLFLSDGMDSELQRQLNVNPVLGDAPVSERLQTTVDTLLRENPGATMAVIPDGPYTMLTRATAPSSALR